MSHKCHTHLWIVAFVTRTYHVAYMEIYVNQLRDQYVSPYSTFPVCVLQVSTSNLTSFEHQYVDTQLCNTYEGQRIALQPTSVKLYAYLHKLYINVVCMKYVDIVREHIRCHYGKRHTIMCNDLSLLFGVIYIITFLVYPGKVLSLKVVC